MPKKEQPPLEYRPVFVQYVSRRRCRYNPSFSRFLDLPATFQQDVEDRWIERHPRKSLPEFYVSKPKPKKEEKRR